MKLVCLILAFSLFAIADCRNTPGWFPLNIIDTVSNKTSQLTNFVREKGRSITRFYSDNIRHKLSSYFSYKHDDDRKNNEDVTLRQDTTNKKFNEYIADAKDNGKEVFDAIAPKTPEYECYDDNPEVHMTTPQLIASHEYPAESHTVLTEDGYLLTLHRIPHGKNSSVLKPRKTVLLHHGLLGSSADWVLTGPKKGLAYILADAGYDVWLANARGNTYSRAHIYKKLDSFAFWNFTFHEIAQYDLPATIDYIMDQKGWEVKINYVGHSMGTTVLFALLSTKTQYNKILRAGFALAPVAYMTKVRSPIHLLAKYADNIEYLLKLLGANEFLPQNAVLRWLSKHACEINHYEEAICENSLFVLCGHDEKQFNRTLLPIILGHMPAGASTKTLVHYAQEIRNNGKFQQFDFGPEGNLREYKVREPPEYPLQKITLPTALLSAENDWLASEKDVTDLYLQLANPIEHFIVPDKDFNHIDFLLAIDAPTLVYKKLLQLMDEGSTSMYDSMEDMNAIDT